LAKKISQSQFCAEDFKTVNKGKKVVWKRMDCKKELHKGMTYNKFEALARDDEDDESIPMDQTSKMTEPTKTIAKVRRMGMLTKARESSVGVCAKSEGTTQPTWRRVAIAIDSGACDSVISPEEVPEHEVHESPESRRGENFQSATGEPIPNLGDIRLPMYLREGSVRGMVMKAAPVTKPLGSVKRICAAGHRVVFDDDGSFIMNKTTGEVNWLREEDGNYVLDAWVPPPAPGVHSASGFPGHP